MVNKWLVSVDTSDQRIASQVYSKIVEIGLRLPTSTRLHVTVADQEVPASEKAPVKKAKKTNGNKRS